MCKHARRGLSKYMHIYTLLMYYLRVGLVCSVAFCEVIVFPLSNTCVPVYRRMMMGARSVCTPWLTCWPVHTESTPHTRSDGGQPW